VLSPKVATIAIVDSSKTMPSLTTPAKPEPSGTALRFPFLDLKAEYVLMKGEIRAAVERVLESQLFIMGPPVRELEAEVAALVGCKFALGCASGSDALLLALMALDVDSGDEVITTPFTFVATAGSIARLEAKPVFVDIDPETYNLDAKQLESAISGRTRAIMPIHLFGLPAEMEAIMRIAQARGVPVIEDAAQSIGSQYYGKNVGNIGEFGWRWGPDHDQRSRVG
jgi:dTDP-4-amino-4,6-dideoxygalactose transaminase